jgi:Uma2 family endonuclease
MGQAMAIAIEALSTDLENDTGIRPHRWTRSELSRAVEAGLFPSSAHMELIDGGLVDKAMQKRPHAISLSKCQQALEAAFGVSCYVSVQAPIALDEENELEPDVMVVFGAPDDYSDHPGPSDVRLVIEVSDATTQYDRVAKSRAYARAGVTEYWILVLKTRTLEVRRNPGFSDEFAEHRYQSEMVFAEGESVIPLATNSAVQVASLLPKPSRQ